MNLFPLDLSNTIHQALEPAGRPTDGLLHCSGDLVGSLRHTMLHAAGAPSRENDVVSSIILETGTLWHRRVGQILVDAGVPFMQEVKLTPWLPEGWGGTADWIFWHPEYQAFVLGDLKTTAGEALPHIEREGIKNEHLHQLSAYWYALRDMGLPLVKGLGVLYFPKNRAKSYDTHPVVIEGQPLDEDYMMDLMKVRRELANEYLISVKYRHPQMFNGELLLTDKLAPPIERVLKTVWNAGQWDVKLVPHWSAQFCPYDDELCDCNTTGETKVGQYQAGYDEIVYIPRKGYEDIEPPVLTSTQIRRLSGTS